MVFVTTPPHTASNARMMLVSDSVGGAEASRNGFSNFRPVNVTASFAAMVKTSGKTPTIAHYNGGPDHRTAAGEFHASESYWRSHSGRRAAERSRGAHRKDSTGRHRRAYPAHRRSGTARRADPRPSGSIQRPVLLSVAGRALVRHRRACARTNDRTDGAVREKISDGDGRPRVRTRASRRVLQHRGGLRHRWHLSRQVPQESHPAYGGVLGKVFLQAGESRLSGLQDSRDDNRRLHLLRPPLSRRRATARPERRRDRFQSVGDRCRPVAVPLETRTAGPCGRQWLLHGLQQPRGNRGAMDYRTVLRVVVLRRSA